MIKKLFENLLLKIEDVDLFNLTMVLTACAKLNQDPKSFHKISDPLIIKL